MPGKLQVRVMSRVVHPALHNQDLCGFVEAPVISLAGRHAKVPRGGYYAGPTTPGAGGSLRRAGP
jgi:hypothetical protein